MLESKARTKFCPFNVPPSPNSEEGYQYCWGTQCMAWRHIADMQEIKKYNEGQDHQGYCVLVEGAD